MKKILLSLFFTTYLRAIAGDKPATAITDAAPRAPPYWPKYGGQRRVELLDGLWQTDRVGSIDHPPNASVFDSLSPDIDPSKIKTRGLVGVPSCVDNAPPGKLGYRGVSFFRRSFRYNLTSTGARLQFQACSFYCRVWIDGKEIGDHRAGGYVAFVLDVPPQPDDDTLDHEIFVLVDNRFNATTAPLHTGGDFWHFGGIMRSVELHAMPPAETQWPWRVYASPTSLSTVDVAVHLTHPTSGIADGLRISFDEGHETILDTIVIDGVVRIANLTVPNPRVWSPADPQLHVLSVTLNGATVRERFGLRLVDVDPETLRVRLNGEAIKMVGWNHHTQWPDTYASPTDAQLDADIALLEEGGANTVRGAHYPQDPRWLDRLDEHGFLMWSETLGPGVKVANTTSDYFLDHQAQQLREMIDNAMNHPSIVFWAFFNEGPAEAGAAARAYAESAAIVRERDPTRLVTYAHNKAGVPPSPECLAAADVVSLNGYPSWYTDADPEPYWNDLVEQYTSYGKPVLISETGAGGIFEWSENATAAKWTLAYQTRIIAADVDAALSDPRLSGILLWHLFDFKVDDRHENNTICDYLPGVYPPVCGYINMTKTTSRPGGLNHKGSVDYWRRKKPVFGVVAAKYKNATTGGTAPEPRGPLPEKRNPQHLRVSES